MSPVIRAKCTSICDDIICFSDLAVVLFYYVQNLGSSFDRLDLVFDQYFQSSLKEETRKNRGSGSRFLFTGETTLPKCMGDNFLKNSENKNDLSEFLAQKNIELHQGNKILIVSFKDTVLYKPSTHAINLPDTSISECQSEEADQRLIRHTLHCLADCQLYERVVIRTIDTDVLILLISYISLLELRSIDVYTELINTPTFYDICKIIQHLGAHICKALSFFSEFTGCDIVSSLYGKGKCKAWDIWMTSEFKQAYTEIFSKLGNKPDSVTEEDLDILEKYVIELYLISAQNKLPPTSLSSMRLNKFKSSPDNDLRKLLPSRASLL